MANSRIGEAYLQLVPSMNGFQKAVQKEVSGTNIMPDDNALGAQAQKAGSGWGKKFAVAAGVALAAGAVIGGALATVVSSSVQAFGELEQNLGGSEAVFGQYAETIQKSGSEAYKKLGVSQSEYLSAANKMGSLFQGSGVDQQTSLDLTTKALQRAADVASVMGIDSTMALESVSAAAKGNFTMMDNLGVAMNATSLEAYAVSKGMTDFKFATAEAATKSELAMAMFFEKTEQYAGNFEKEATETVTGAFGMMRASWSEVLANLGNEKADMGALTANLTDSIQTVIKNVKPIVVQILQTLPSVISGIVAEIPAIFSEVFGSSDMFGGLFAGIQPLLGLVSSLSPLSLLFQTLVAQGPLIGKALLPLGEILTTTVIPAVGLIVEALTPLLGTVIELAGSLITALLPAFSSMMAVLVPIIVMLVQMLAPILTVIVQILGVILPPIITVIGAVVSMVLGGNMMAFYGWSLILVSIVNAIIDGANAFGAGWTRMPLPQAPQLPGLAAGGNVAASPGGTPVILGEGGKAETVTDLGRTNQLISNAVDLSERAMAGGSGGQSQSIQIVVNQQPGEPTEELVQRIADFITFNNVEGAGYSYA